MKLLGVVVLAVGALGIAIDSSKLTVDLPTVTITTEPRLQKRYKKVHLPKSTDTSSTETPRPWIRTIYGTKKEIVTPTVIADITFSGKPLTETNGPIPWISLKKDGSPQTIKPKIKNGHTEQASPDYSTYFKTATTITYDYDMLQAHNMDPNSKHEEIEFIDEDKTYVSLNPLLRCTPDRFYMKGIDRQTSSAPFCTPKENTKLKMDQTYFVTWYTRFFGSAEKVRIHLSYVKQKAHDQGMNKREVDSAFFSSEWLENTDGYYPLTVAEKWLLGEFEQNVAISIQPDTISDDEFYLMTNATIFQITKGTRVFKNTKDMRAQLDEGIDHDGVYYAILSLPAVIAVFILGMYFFLYLTKNNRDISSVRYKVWKSQHKVLGKFKGTKNRAYTELPKYNKANKMS